MAMQAESEETAEHPKTYYGGRFVGLRAGIEIDPNLDEILPQ